MTAWLVIRIGGIYNGSGEKVCSVEVDGLSNNFMGSRGSVCRTEPQVFTGDGRGIGFFASFIDKAKREGWVKWKGENYKFVIKGMGFHVRETNWDEVVSYPVTARSMIDNQRHVKHIKDIIHSIYTKKNLYSFLLGLKAPSIIDEKWVKVSSGKKNEFCKLGSGDINDPWRVSSVFFDLLQDGLYEEELRYLLNTIKDFNFHKVDINMKTGNLYMYRSPLKIKLLNDSFFKELHLTVSPYQKYFNKIDGVDGKKYEQNYFSLVLTLKNGVTCKQVNDYLSDHHKKMKKRGNDK